MSKGKIRIFVSFYDELADARHKWIPLDVTIIDTSYDMIIGKYSKIEHNLYHKLNYQFEQSRLMNSLETKTFRN